MNSKLRKYRDGSSGESRSGGQDYQKDKNALLFNRPSSLKGFTIIDPALSKVEIVIINNNKR